MPYLFTCPHCQTQTQVEDRFSGQSGKCVTCGAPIELPHFAVGVSASPKPKKLSKAAGLAIATAVSVILIGCLLFAIIRFGGRTMNRISASRERSSSISNLEKIAEALNAYAADHGTYPPPLTRDANQRPLHSWRVLILPYLGEEELYNQIDLQRGWDDPENMQVARDGMPAVYRHPNSITGFYESGYFLITGQGTVFPTSGPMGPDQIVDDPSQTILVIEGTPQVPSGMWTEPVDLDFALIQGKLGLNPGIEPGGLLEDGVALSTVDGRGHFISNTIEPMTFRSLVTPRGGEPLADDTLD